MTLDRSKLDSRENAKRMKTRSTYTVHAVCRCSVVIGLLAAGLFLAAGTTHIPMLRAYLVVFLVMLLITMLAVDPGLAHERTRPQAGGLDGRSRFGAGFLFLVTVGFAAMDVGRLHQSDSVPIPVSVLALAGFSAALGFQIWALIVNPFLSHHHAPRTHGRRISEAKSGRLYRLYAARPERLFSILLDLNP